ncbi:hypothetical protein N9842_00345 [Porticoccaceae bacterium]|jgi:hypothetical protein|nr:hypothetical protein [Porticoccaceae bacterium]MDB9724439.1 hypothetical protein [bacterium]MDA9352352.1 hypothetical protein [Porticoccaceae bacterium]MDB4077238.1 hypothetical protein [Porticoccaceae bacterium]MDB4262636.1 hypothetical protein [Porticoccaceae bacterium]|tara:strand:- start:393 stop:611 length:219 start_codon:yes stop_codon:yes gene_type:complete
MAKLKKEIRQRSAWIASMLGCLAFLLMAVKVYDVPVSTMTANLMFMLGGLMLIIGAAAMLGWMIAYLRKRFR